MKIFNDKLEKFMHCVDGYLMDFEEDYNSPNTAKNLKKTCTQLLWFINYEPQYSTNAKEGESQFEDVNSVKTSFKEALVKMEALTAESNVFDILEAYHFIIGKCSVALMPDGEI